MILSNDISVHTILIHHLECDTVVAGMFCCEQAHFPILQISFSEQCSGNNSMLDFGGKHFTILSRLTDLLADSFLASGSSVSIHDGLFLTTSIFEEFGVRSCFSISVCFRKLFYGRPRHILAHIVVLTCTAIVRSFYAHFSAMLTCSAHGR